MEAQLTNNQLQTSKAYLDNLTALRGIAALLVVVFHGNEMIAPFIKTETTFWFRKLYLMVDLFFILSGFIMCYVYEAGFADPDKHNKIGSFLKARFARIYPLHFVTLMFSALFIGITYILGKYEYLGVVGMAIFNVKSLFSNLLLLQSAHVEPIFTWNVPSWSISAEWIAYLLFPFLVVPFSKFNPIKTVLAIVFIFGLYAILIFYISPNRPMLFPFLQTGYDLDVTFDWGFARGILGFTLGMCIYRMYVNQFLKAPLSNGWVLAGIAVLYSLYAHFNGSDFAAPLFFSVILLSSVYGSKGINAFYENRILQKLGDWSFSIYMWHLVLYTIVTSIAIGGMSSPPPDGPPGEPDYFGLTNIWIILPIYVGLTIAVGAFSFNYIERPSRLWINSWGNKKG
ncbi:MAG: acyltransferase family protein [Saprospiraceae bacterium]